WTIRRSLDLAREVQRALAARNYRDFLANMYGSEPDQWSDKLKGWDRLRVIVNAMTRMRFATRKGKMDFYSKGKAAPEGYSAWFDLRPKEKAWLICGHWSALGLKLRPRLAALDSGCVWGGKLSALRLEDRKLYQVPCRGYQQSGE